MKTEAYLNIIIGIIACGTTLVIGILQVLRDKDASKFIGYPYSECDSGVAWKYIIKTDHLWKLNYFLTFAVMALYFAGYFYVFKTADFISGYTKRVFWGIIAINIITLIIKDLFHNVFAYKKTVENIFRKCFDNIELVLFIEIVEFLIIIISVGSILIASSFYVNDICMIIIIFVTSICSCLFRIMNEEAMYIHYYFVKDLTIIASDGTEYSKMKEINDFGETIRLHIDNDTIIYLPKNSIVCIKKKIDNVNAMEVLKNKSQMNQLQ